MKNLILLFLLLPTFLAAQKISEAQYICMINEELQGQMVYRVTSGRVDILTETHAIEVERAHKWKQSIGQALWYGLQTSKEPGIIIIIEQLIIIIDLLVFKLNYLKYPVIIIIGYQNFMI